ncbi:MAG: hypothetical protein AAB344_06780 [Bacteroidota bacterium]
MRHLKHIRFGKRAADNLQTYRELLVVEAAREHLIALLRYRTCMQNLHQNRILAFTFCVALSLSSVGLPVMVVACRMGTAVVAKSCVTTCGEAGNAAQRITRPPCRAQLFFIERNTTAHLRTKPEADPSGLQIHLVVSPLSTGLISSSCAKPETSPPFIRDDISILISSLLI